MFFCPFSLSRFNLKFSLLTPFGPASSWQCESRAFGIFWDDDQCMYSEDFPGCSSSLHSPPFGRSARALQYGPARLRVTFPGKSPWLP